MDFSPNKTPIEIIKEGAFGGTYFRDIYSNINKKWYKNSWKEFVHLKNIDPEFYASDYYDINVNKYNVKYETSLVVNMMIIQFHPKLDKFHCIGVMN